MRAAVSERYGPPEVVKVIDDAPVPGVGPDDLLVRVHATTVNRTDCGYRGASPFFIRGISGLRRPATNVWGTEFAGVVERVGLEVTRFAPGDEVFGYAEGRFGTHAEYVAVSVTSLVAPVPDGVDLPTAAAATEGGHYALSSIRRAGIQPGQRVQVTATASTAHLDLVRRLGAHEVIDRETHDFTRTGRTYHAVLDMVGKSTFRACRRILVPGGVYVSSELGPFAQNIALPLVTRVGRARRRRVVFPFPMETPEVLEHLRSRLASGAFRPVLDRTFPLEDIVEAYRYVESGHKVGNVVISVRAA